MISLNHLNKKRLIGFHGPYGSGKDTLSTRLAGIINATVDRVAAPLYQMAAAIDPTFRPDMPHSAKNGYVLGNSALGTRRAFLEKAGTDFARDMINPDFWIILQDMRWKASMRSMIIADIRPKNEQDWLLRNGGILFHLKPGWDNQTNETGHRISSPLSIQNPEREFEIPLVWNDIQGAMKIIQDRLGLS